MDYLAKNYSTRRELEEAVSKDCALTPDAKPEYAILGTDTELARLGLSRRTFFYGITCKSTDLPNKKAVVNEKPSRGEVKKFGLNQ